MLLKSLTIYSLASFQQFSCNPAQASQITNNELNQPELIQPGSDLDTRAIRSVSDDEIELEKLEDQALYALAQISYENDEYNDHMVSISDHDMDGVIGDYFDYESFEKNQEDISIFDDIFYDDNFNDQFAEDFYKSIEDDLIYVNSEDSLYDDENDSSDLDRYHRASGFRTLNQRISRKVPMCNAQMNVIFRQAKMAATLLSTNRLGKSKGGSDNFNRRTRGTASTKSIMRKNPGAFCKSLHMKLKRVYADIILIEPELQKRYGASHVRILKQTLKQLKESLQEQMNRYNVPYSIQDFSNASKQAARSRGNLPAKSINGLKARAESQIDGLVATLANLQTGCQRLKRKVAGKRKSELK